ncbi:hypothetical protein EIP91_002103 [Steccherinum ochraceum]|uniref:Uncharacterized protein n=1 Tax=Steccherinum ochraceum TaxID=92696 RepID=A0A4V2MXM7_9APHY|nr:hypothetical protein EIP91_002103 [Steccherinum ochraceum]
MRFTAVITGLLVVAVSSASAGPLHRFQARDETALKARDLDLVVRDVLQAIHARELADLEARAVGIPSSLLKRKDPEPKPAEWELPKKPDPSEERQGTVVEPQLTPEQQARIDAQNEEIRNRPAPR